MSGAPLPWQEAAWREIGATLDAGKLPHALLLAGPRAIGKLRFAIALAARLVCEQPRAGAACGACRSCLLVAAGTHPGATLLSPEGHFCLARSDDGRAEGAIPLWTPEKESKRRDIAADGVRDLIQRLTLSGQFGGAKVAVIAPVDDLNGSSVNMLLKTIEEPAAKTYLLLVAEGWQALPATLRSRCRILRLAPPPRDQALAWLKQAHPDAAAPALEAAARRPLAAAELLEPQTVARQQEWLRGLAALAAGDLAPLKQAEKVKREDAQAWLDWLLRSAAEQARRPGERDAALWLWEEVMAARRDLDRGQPTLIMESIMIRWWREGRARAVEKSR